MKDPVDHVGRKKSAAVGVQLPWWCLAIWLGTAGASAQIVINEILADNKDAVSHGGGHPDYVELHNPLADAFNLAGMSLTDDPARPRRFVFPPGVSIPAHGYLLVWCGTNTAAPGLWSGFGLAASGDLIRLYAANGMTVLDEVRFGLQAPDLSLGRLPNGSGSWALTRPTPLAANEVEPLAEEAGQLRLNEWMAKPATGDDWLEVYNSGSQAVALSGLVITDRASGVPTNRPIPALSFIEPHGFVQFFASDLDKVDADHLDFKLSTDGETLTIYAVALAQVLDRVSFGSQSANISQGRVPDGSDVIAFFPAGQATPGEPNFASLLNVVISEVLSHTDPPFEDAVELHNLTAAAVDISHWWLSDSAAQPKKYRIPAGTVLPAGGFKVFYEYQIGAGANGFTFNSWDGDEVYLSVGDAAGNLTGGQTYVAFGALKNGVSAGRHPTSAGVDFVPLSQRTFGMDNPSTLVQFRQGGGLSNAAPRVGPVVITEIMPYPPDLNGQSNTGDEFIELHNPQGSLVRLYDYNFPTNRWRVRDAVTFNFPANITLAAGGYLLLVSFDPVAEPARASAFRTRYSVPAGVQLLGPYDGKLSDSGETLQLLWPDRPEPIDEPKPGFVPYELVERIKYSSAAPWPTGVSGTGQSLQRRSALSYGNEPLNWLAGPPTAGRGTTLDSDVDGMPDEWETAHEFDPNLATDAVADADNDGATNLAEFLAGTDPREGQSVFRILAARPGPGCVRVTFLAVLGRSYTVQGCDRMNSNGWQTLTNIASARVDGPMDVVVADSQPGQRFYRMITPALP